MAGRVDLIYHESQQAALCGVHAVNALLQAPHFSEVEMATIAAELDAAERALMASGGVESAEYLQYLAEGSGNAADNGMFSIQVLSKALEIFGLGAVPFASPDPAAAAARQDPTACEAFICNLQEHWFTIRRIHDQWWNLNSIYSAPEPLSAFYLSAYLGSLREQGYTIFVITGPLPPIHPPDAEEERAAPGLAGRWWTPEEARAATQEKEALKESGWTKALAEGVLDKAAAGGQQGTWLTLRRPGGNKRAHSSGSDDGFGAAGGDDDADLQRALAASMADADRPARGAGAGAGGSALGSVVAASDEDADLAAAIAASLADQGGAAGGSQQQQQQQQAGQAAAATKAEAVAVDLVGDHGGMDGDAELQAAIAASLSQPEPAAAAEAAGEQQQQQAQQAQQPELPELPPEPEAGAEGAVEVALRLPGGGRCSRRFASAEAATVGHLAAVAAAAGADMGSHQLAVAYPRRVLVDWGQSLATAGVRHRQILTVELK